VFQVIVTLKYRTSSQYEEVPFMRKTNSLGLAALAALLLATTGTQAADLALPDSALKQVESAASGPVENAPFEPAPEVFALEKPQSAAPLRLESIPQEVNTDEPGLEEPKPEEPKPEEPKPEEPKPEEPKPEEPKPEEPKPEEPKPEQPKPEEPKPEEPKPEEPKPEEPKPEQPKPEEPKPEEPKPEEPKPEEPKPEQPKPEEPKPEEPKPEEPKPEEPKLEQPKPEQPKPEESKIEEPKPEPADEPKEGKSDDQAISVMLDQGGPINIVGRFSRADPVSQPRRFIHELESIIHPVPGSRRTLPRI
jgi:hypothetical protein